MFRRFAELARSRAAEAHDFYLAPRVHLQVLDERDEIAVARDEDDRVEFGRCGDGVDRHADVPVRLLGATVEYLELFGLGLDADFGERFEEGGLLAAFRRHHVGAGADEVAAGDRIFQDVAEINARVINIFRAVVEILRVDEYTDALF